jgi:hypothetical protein
MTKYVRLIRNALTIAATAALALGIDAGKRWIP